MTKWKQKKALQILKRFFYCFAPSQNGIDTFSILKEKRQMVPWIKLTQPDYTITVKCAVAWQIEKDGMLVDQSIQIFQSEKVALELEIQNS